MRQGVGIVWAVADHPWVEDTDGAAVRVALTVLARDPASGVVVSVDQNGAVIRELVATRIHPDLTAAADVSSTAATGLRGNQGLSSRGYSLVGRGFVLGREEAEGLLLQDRSHSTVVRPYLNGRDLASRRRGVYAIDFGLRTEEQAREYPILYDIVRTRVKPERDANADKGRRTNWWRFGRTNENLRRALSGLRRYIVTPYVSKHSFFQFLDVHIAADEMLVCIADEDAFVLGVVSSLIHTHWALAAGSRLGVGNDPRYNNNACFDAFPFPTPTPDLRAEIGEVAERLDEHRNAALARDERVTMTGMYNVVEKLRLGEALTTKEREVHQIAACGVLRDLHDELDWLVAEAYGWQWPMEREEILERLVALHEERVEEERRGLVRWLRPEYQIPRFGRGGDAGHAAELALADAEAAPAASAERRPWPAGAVEQITALKAQVAAASATAEEAAAAFDGAPPALVRQYLDALVMAGEVRLDPDSGRFAPVAEPL
jgi:hypothetical protein